MANQCSNEVYFNTENVESQKIALEVLEKQGLIFLDSWEDSGVLSTELSFESRWVFPEKELKELFENETVKNDDTFYFRCLSVEYGNDYVAYHTYEGGELIERV